MNKFQLTKSNMDLLSFKDRIKLVQNLVGGLGKQLTHKQAKSLVNELCSSKTYQNDIYCVHHFQKKQTNNYIWNMGFVDHMDYLSIKRIDKSPARSWTDFQNIKNELIEDGKDRYAVEIYPPEDRLVNTANQYHLWILPIGFDIGFGFKTRVTGDVGVNVEIDGLKFNTKQGEQNE
jgi:hypothetical protein